MVTKHPIICPHCKKESGLFSEDYMYMVIIYPVYCLHCGEIVLYPNGGITY